jgi:hypothetical protein
MYTLILKGLIAITKISARNLRSLQIGERGMMGAFLRQKPEEEGVVVFSRTQSLGPQMGHK